jgi:hypothetical protein
VPPELSYFSTWSATYCCGLGAYSVAAISAETPGV